MNWYHRGERRYVEYGSSFRASLRFGLARQLTDTIYNMNGAHLAADALTVFEQLDDARAADRRHDLPDVPRPPPPQAGPRDGADAARRALARSPARCSARASCSTPTSSPSREPAATARSGCPVCATVTPAASAPTWSSTTCSTFCCSRCPTTTTTRIATARRPDRLAAAGRSPARARCSRPAAAPTASCAITRVIVVADHAHTLVEQDDLAGRRVHRPTSTFACPTDLRPAGQAEVALCPARARRCSTCSGRAAGGRDRPRATDRGRRARHLARRRRPR